MRQGLKNEMFYRISSKEQVVLILRSVIIVALINYCFYRHPFAFFILFPIGVIYYRMEKKELLHQKKEEAREQFKDMLLLVVAGQKAGYSVENAFLKSYEDMNSLYGKDSSICKMLELFKREFTNHVPVFRIWIEIGINSEIEEIQEFSEVFVIAKENGGNMTTIMERTAESISSKAETQKEIEALLSARKLEQKIMSAIPFLLMLYMNVTSPDYFDGLYHSVPGVILMSICLLLYLMAYRMGVKIIHVYVS